MQTILRDLMIICWIRLTIELYLRPFLDSVLYTLNYYFMLLLMTHWWHSGSIIPKSLHLAAERVSLSEKVQSSSLT